MLKCSTLILGEKHVKGMPMEHKKLFGESFRKCVCCDRFLPDGYEGDMCPRCEENELFAKVKEFIRKNDVTEWQVAQEFNLPRRRVRHWIAEGRIEYKNDGEEHLGQIYERCEICGEPIKIGSVCPHCAKNARGHAVSKPKENGGNDVMWYNSK